MLNLLKSFQRKLELQQYWGLPDFIILGAQKAGTTALYDYINEHPGVIPSKIKESHYFDRSVSRSQGQSYYLRNFPNAQQKQKKADVLGYYPLSGEATGAYLFHPLVPKFVSSWCKQFDHRPKFIILLRDPVERALSHYAHNCRINGRERLSFHDAIIAEDSRIQNDLKELYINSDYHPQNLLRYSYYNRGLYMQQINRWIRYFELQNFYFISSSDLLSSPNMILNQVFSFLGLPEFNLISPVPKHVGKYEKNMVELDRNILMNKFRNDSQELFTFLGRQLWNLN